MTDNRVTNGVVMRPVSPFLPPIPLPGTPAAIAPAAPAVAPDSLAATGKPAAAADPVSSYPTGSLPDIDPAAFLGRVDVIQDDLSERNRVFAGQPTISLAEFVSRAQIAQMTPGQLAAVFKSATGGADAMTPAIFDKVYAASTLVGAAYHTVLRRPMSTESTNIGRKLDDAVAQTTVSSLATGIAQLTAGWTDDQKSSLKTLQDLTQDDPQAARALDVMVATGKLVGPQAQDGLLDALANLGTAELAPGFDRGKLVKDAVQEIMDPTRINQGPGFGTCASTAVQILMVSHRPTDYVNLLAGLASPEGEVALPTGATLTAVAGVEVANKDDARSLTSRMFQSAAQQFGAETPYVYTGTPSQSGLSSIGKEHLLHNLLGGKVDLEVLQPGQFTAIDQKAVMDHLAQAASTGNPVVAGVVWGDGVTPASTATHALLVTGVQGDTISLINPQGDEETMTRAEFLKRLRDVEFVGEGSADQATGVAARDQIIAELKAKIQARNQVATP